MDGVLDLPRCAAKIEFDNAAQLTAFLREYRKFRCSLFFVPEQQGCVLLVPALLRVQSRRVFSSDQAIELVRLVKHVEEYAKKSAAMHPVSLLCFENVNSGVNQYLVCPDLKVVINDRDAFEKTVYDSLVQWLEPRVGFRLTSFSARHTSIWISLCERIYAWAMLGHIKIQTKLINQSHLRELEAGFPLALVWARLPEIVRITNSLRSEKGITVVAIDSFEEAAVLIGTLKIICQLLGRSSIVVDGELPCDSRVPAEAAVLLNAVDYSLDGNMRSWLFENAGRRHVTLFLNRRDAAFRSVIRNARANTSEDPVLIEVFPFTHRQVGVGLISLCLPQDYEKVQQAMPSLISQKYTLLRQIFSMLATASCADDGARLIGGFDAGFFQNSLLTLSRIERRVIEIIHLCIERPKTELIAHVLGEPAGLLLDNLRDLGFVDEINGWFLTSAKPETFTELVPSKTDSLIADFYGVEGRICLRNFHLIRSGTISDENVLVHAMDGLSEHDASLLRKRALFLLVFEQLELGGLAGGRELMAKFILSGAKIYGGDIEILQRMLESLVKLKVDPLEASDVFIIYLEALKRHGRYVEALDQGVNYVRALGLNISRAPNNFDVFVEIIKTWGSIFRAGGKIVNVRDDAMRSQRSDVLNKVLWALGGAAYMAMPKLLAIFSAIGVRLGLRYGVRPESMLGIAGFAYIEQEIALQRNIPASAKRAVGILQQAREITFNGSGMDNDVRADLVEYGMVRPWHNGQLFSSVEKLRQSYFEGTRAGDEEYALYCAAIGSLSHITAGGRLDIIAREIETPFIHSIQANQRTTIRNFAILSGFLSACTGASSEYQEGDVPSLNEPFHLTDLLAQDRTAAAVYYALAGFRALIFGDYQVLDKLAEYDADVMIEGVQGQQLALMITFVCVVAHLHLGNPQITPVRRSRREVKKRLANLKRWAKYAPDNFEGIYTLASAIYQNRMRNSGIAQLARACDICESHGQIHWAAIGREQLAYAEINVAQMVDGRNSLDTALKHFERWGAVNKVYQLKNRINRVVDVGKFKAVTGDAASPVVPYMRIRQFETLFDASCQTVQEYLASGFQALASHGVVRLSIADTKNRRALSYCVGTGEWEGFIDWAPLRILLAKQGFEKDKSLVDSATGEILIWLGSQCGCENYLYAVIGECNSRKAHVVYQALKRHRGTLGLAFASKAKGSPETERFVEFAAAGTEELRAALDYLSAIENEYAMEAKKIVSNVISARLEMAVFLRASRFTGFVEKVTILEQIPLDNIVKELLAPLNIVITRIPSKEIFLSIRAELIGGVSKVVLSVLNDAGDFVVIDGPVTAVKILKAAVARYHRR